MATTSSWVRPMVWLAALVAMALPLLGSNAGHGMAVDEIHAIEALLAAQEEAWNEGDIEGFLAAYAKRDDLLFASGVEITEGFETVAERYRNRYDSRTKMGTLQFTLMRVDLLGTAHAKVLGRWELQRESDRPHGLFTLVLERGVDGWMVIHDHTSSATP